jgi:hypothetical protein
VTTESDQHDSLKGDEVKRVLQPTLKGAFTMSVTYGPSTALITCSGPASVSELCGTVWFGSEIARRTKLPNFLFDFQAIKFQGTDEDREELGLIAASLLAEADRIAVVLSPSENYGTGERVAREAGLKLCNFENFQEAVNWLDGDQDDQPDS